MKHEDSANLRSGREKEVAKCSRCEKWISPKDWEDGCVTTKHIDSGMRCLVVHGAAGQCIRCSQCEKWIVSRDWEEKCSGEIDNQIREPMRNVERIADHQRTISTVDSYTILPSHPNDEVSTPLRENVPGIRTTIHEFRVPAGCYVIMDEFKVLFHPRDINGNSMGGTCEIFRVSPFGRMERVWAWAHNTHPWIRRIIHPQRSLLSPGDSLRMEFLSDKSFAASKTDYEMIVNLGKVVE